MAMNKTEEQIYKLNNQIESMQDQKRKLLQEREKEIKEQYIKMIKDDTNDLTNVILNSLINDIKNLYRV